MNEFQNVGYGAYGDQQQFAPQGFFGSLLGAPLGGMLGRGIGGLLGNQRLGNQIGQAAGGIGGAFLPFAADPVQQAQQQMLEQQIQQQQLQQAQMQQQLAPQGFFGNLLGQVGRPLGNYIGGHLGNAGLGSTLGGMAGSLGRMLPFGADPSAMAQQQIPPQVHQQLIQQIQQLQQQLQQQQQQYAQLVQMISQQQQPQQQQLGQQGQQGQISPQGWFGNLIGQVGQPLGGAIGGMFGNSGLGSQIGGVAGQIGRMLPFGADPISQAYAQQQMAQQAQQSQLGQGNSYYPVQGMQYSQQPTLH